MGKFLGKEKDSLGDADPHLDLDLPALIREAVLSGRHHHSTSTRFTSPTRLYIQLMKDCWNQNPQDRRRYLGNHPHTSTISQTLQSIVDFVHCNNHPTTYYIISFFLFRILWKKRIVEPLGIWTPASFDMGTWDPLLNRSDKGPQQKKQQEPARFELARENHTALAGQPVNHSGKAPEASHHHVSIVGLKGYGPFTLPLRHGESIIMIWWRIG